VWEGGFFCWLVLGVRVFNFLGGGGFLLDLSSSLALYLES